MHELPDVAVGVFEPVAVHEPVILRIARGRSAVLDRQQYEFVHPVPALAAQAIKHLGRPVRVGDGLAGKRGEERLDEQHYEDVIGHDNTGRLVIAELLVEAEAEPGVEGPRLAEVLDGQVDENGLNHRNLLVTPGAWTKPHREAVSVWTIVRRRCHDLSVPLAS